MMIFLHPRAHLGIVRVAVVSFAIRRAIEQRTETKASCRLIGKFIVKYKYYEGERSLDLIYV